MNNSVFGKMMENICKRVDVRLVTNEKKLDKLTTKPIYVSSKIFNENLMAVHKVKETLTLNMLAYVGMCILDLSKTLMYNFHYTYIKKKYNNGARLWRAHHIIAMSIKNHFQIQGRSLWHRDVFLCQG